MSLWHAVDMSIEPAALPVDRGRRLLPDPVLPGWMRPIVRHIEDAPLPDWVLRATDPPAQRPRRGAVLMLLADDGDGPDVLLTGRAATLRAHAGQPAFPGGEIDPGEDPVAAALRESREETGVEPDSVDPAALLPQLYLGPSRFLVQPVLAHWRRPGPVHPVDPAETATVARVPLAQLADPAHRGSVIIPPAPGRGLRHTLRSPAFEVADMLVWGFTAGLLDLLLEWGGWARPWDRQRVLQPPGDHLWTPAAAPDVARPSGGDRSR